MSETYPEKDTQDDGQDVSPDQLTTDEDEDKAGGSE